MQLLTRRSAYNFYESFSDLIFCSLVLFIVLVLFLVMNVDKRADSVRQKATTVQKQQQTLDVLLGTRRFTGRSAIDSTLHVMADVRDEENLRIWPIPAELTAEYGTQLHAATVTPDAEHRITSQQRDVLIRAQEVMQKVRPLTPAEFGQLFDSFTPFLVASQEEYRSDGMLWIGSPGGALIAAVDPESPAYDSGIQRGDFLLTFGGRPFPAHRVTDETVWNVRNEILSGLSAGERVTCQVKRGEETLEREIGIYDANRLWNIVTLRWFGPFNYLASGWIDVDGNTVGNPASAEHVDKQLANLMLLRADAERTRALPERESTLPILLCTVGTNEKTLTLSSGLVFDVPSFVNLVQAIGHRGVAIEFENQDGSEDLPDWVTKEVLVPTGYVNRAPLLQVLESAGSDASNTGQAAEPAADNENSAGE